jgi:hypothetical protein
MSGDNWLRVLESERRIWVDNGVVGVELRREGSCTLHSVTDLRSGTVYGLQASEAGVWWELEWRDRDGFKAVVNNMSAPCKRCLCAVVTGEAEAIVQLRWPAISVREARYGAVHVADVVDPGGSPEIIEVEVQIKLRPDDPLTYWRIAVHSQATRYTLWRVTFIKLADVHGVGADRQADFITLPVDNGWDMPRPLERRLAWTATYPSHRCAMQFMAFRNADRGLYIGWHDPTAKPKHFRAAATAAGRLEVSFDHPPEHMTRVQREVAVDHLVLGVFAGDWYDAASIYSAWALEQKWTRKGLVAERSDIPAWFKDTVIWWCLSSGKDTGSLTTEREVLVEETADLALRLRERFPYPTGVHWYNWHRIPFNTSFPDYLPAKEGFAQQVARLAAAGVMVMPYINARLVDPNSRAWQEEGAERYCARKASPRCEPAHFPIAYELYPGEQHIVPMCSATAYWQEKVAEIVRAMRDELGIRVLYLDQIAAGTPPLCFAPDHGHPQGGGDYGVRGYERLLELVQQAGWADDGPMAITTESNAEPFMAGVPAYLMWMPCPEYQVPLFAAVYSGYVITFGRSFYDVDLEEPDAFAAKIAQAFTWGCQLGWIRNSVAEKLLTGRYAREADFLGAVCAAFASGREFLVEGRMLRPPVAISPVGMLVTKWYNAVVRLPVVMATIWRSPAGALAMAIANLAGDTACVRYRVEHAVTSGEVHDLTGAGVTGTVSPAGSGVAEVTLTVPGRSAAMVRLD